MTRRPTTVLAAAMGAAVLTGTTPAVAATSTPTAVPANRQASLTAAQEMLSNAQARLVAARADAAAVRIDAADGVLDPETVTAVGGTPFTSGASDLELMAGLIDPADPASALAGATVAELGGAAEAPKPDQPTGPVVRTPAQAIALADRKVKLAERRAQGAQALIRQIEHPGTADGPGAAKLANLCATAGVVIEQCQPVRWTEGHLQYDTVMIGRTVNVTWPAIKVVGGWRPSDPYPDHPSGRAADIMMPNGGEGSDVKLGNAIARYFQQHAKEYGIQYMIWRQQQWTAGSPVGSWNAMSDRGSPTANHFDHVHITVTDGNSGTAFKQLVKEARAAGLSIDA